MKLYLVTLEVKQIVKDEIKGKGTESKMGNTWLLEYWKTGRDLIEHRGKKTGQQSIFWKENGKIVKKVVKSEII